jgi:hypothetical protein
MAFVPAQTKFRFYNDDGGLTAATPVAAENTDITVAPGAGNRSFQLKIQVQETGGSGGVSTDDWQLICGKNLATTFPVTTSSSGVRAFNSGNLVDAGNVSSGNRSLSAGSGSYVTGKISEDGLVDNLNLTANNYTELVFAIQTVDADLAPGDTLDFRILCGTPPPIASTATARITMQASSITGATTATLGGLTSSSTSTLKLNAAVSSTLQAVQLVSAATLPVHASLSQTLAAVTSSSTSTLPLHGTVSATLANATGSSTGSSTVGGSLSAVLANLLTSSAGSLPITAGLTATFAELLASSAGGANLPVVAEADVSLAPVAVSSEAVLTQRAVVEQTLDDLTLEVDITKPYPFGQIKVYLDGAWRAKPLKVWDGEAWVQKPLKIFDGVDWHVTLY